MDTHTESKFPFGALTYQIIAEFLEVFRELGHGFSEAVYCRALAIVLLEPGFEVAVEHELPVMFHGQVIGAFKADIIVNQSIILEIKATQTIENHAIAQGLNYLKAAGGGVGPVLNFGKKPEHKRLVMGDNPADSLPLLRTPI